MFLQKGTQIDKSVPIPKEQVAPASQLRIVEDEKKVYKKNSKDSHLLFAYSIKMSLWQASYFEVTECTELTELQHNVAKLLKQKVAFVNMIVV